MQKITLRISALDKKAEERAARDLLELLNRYRPTPGVILYVEGEKDLSEIFRGPLLNDKPSSSSQTSTKEDL
jgi:hypothetical protein